MSEVCLSQKTSVIADNTILCTALWLSDSLTSAVNSVQGSASPAVSLGGYLPAAGAVGATQEAADALAAGEKELEARRRALEETETTLAAEAAELQVRMKTPTQL